MPTELPQLHLQLNFQALSMQPSMSSPISSGNHAHGLGHHHSAHPLSSNGALMSSPQLRCSNVLSGLNPVEQTLYKCGEDTCEDGRFCLACIDTCHRGHTSALKGRQETGICECQIRGVCQLFKGTIADLPAFKCDNCRHTIRITIHVHRGPTWVRYLCDTCGRRQAATAEPPEAVYVVPYISSMTWPKLRLRLDRAKAMANLYKDHVLPEKHRWNRTHWGYRCELCARIIKGPRYQCMECPSWDSLCSDCWHDHDSNHALFIVNRPLGNLSPEPLAMRNVVKIHDNEYKYGPRDTIRIQSPDMVEVECMSLHEILMTYQALVLGAGHLAQTPDCWTHIANAIANIYESLAEFHAKRESGPHRGRTFLDFATRHFDGHVSADIREPESPSKRLSKRQSILSLALVNKMLFAATGSSSSPSPSPGVSPSSNLSGYSSSGSSSPEVIDENGSSSSSSLGAFSSGHMRRSSALGAMMMGGGVSTNTASSNGNGNAGNTGSSMPAAVGPLAQLQNHSLVTTKTLPNSCFYFKLGNRTVFVIRTGAGQQAAASAITDFYRIELADAEGRPYETGRVRSAFVQASATEVTPFTQAFGHKILNAIDAIEE
ncbi:hypothetical protein BC831DRAFT_444541 [Entophlyctis helioformis]|nr:hypothetical protein BC831DRAFT_444541 [Entophlyctis helioformis]